MATTGVATRSGNLSGGPAGPRTWFDSVPFTAAVDETLVSTVSTNTTITVPTGATFCRIIGPNALLPNPAYAGVLTLKGVAGDTGNAISAKYPTELVWDTAPASFVLNATVSCTVEFFFA